MILKSKIKTLFLAVVSLFILNPLFANNNAHDSSKGGHKEEGFNVGEVIMHHIQDAHEWHLWGGHHNSVSVYLPIILNDGGFKVFSSENFYHGVHKTAIDHKTHEEVSYVAGKGPASGYAMFHEEIYKLNAKGELVIDSIQGQVKQVMHNIGELLKSAQMDYSNIVKTSIFLTDMNDFVKVNEIYATYFTSNFPARETIQVSALPKGVNVEISVIAIAD